MRHRSVVRVLITVGAVAALASVAEGRVTPARPRAVAPSPKRPLVVPMPSLASNPPALDAADPWDSSSELPEPSPAPAPRTDASRIDRVDPWAGAVLAPVTRAAARIDTQDPWARKVSDDDVEAALLKALVAATDAGRFDVVAQLAHDLESRRAAKTAPHAVSAAPSGGMALDRADPWR